jgi:hypothetical protein
MDEELKTELEKIVQAVEFLSEGGFVFAGRRSAELPLLAAAPTPGPNLLAVVAQLQEFLYAYCYIRRFAGEAPVSNTLENPVDVELVEQLSRANTSRDCWEKGWKIYDFLQTGQVLVEKHNMVRAVWSGEFVTHDIYGRAPQAGAQVSIFLPRESRTVQPGFYFALGETAADQQDDYHIVRFYWNVDHAAAPAVVEAVTREFNRFEAPFRFKCPSHRAAYERSDSAVLYVSQRLFRIAAELVARITSALADHLRETTPLFTKRISCGLAFAEDPGGHESFGQSRCRMLAQGLWNAHQRGARDTDSRLEEVAQEFARNQISLDRPYLNAGSLSKYEFPQRLRAQSV